jgi:predicted transcriptional regulator of viral defense system
MARGLRPRRDASVRFRGGRRTGAPRVQRTIVTYHVTMSNRVDFEQLWSRLLAEGQGSISTQQIRHETGAQADAVRAATARAVEKGLLFTPTKGLYVPVPPKYRSWGVVPAEHFIDDMMRHLACSYYVTFLSAAAHWGSSHHAVQEFQVAVERQVRNRDIERIRLRFHHVNDIKHRHTRRVNGAEAMVNMATPDQCVVDLVSAPNWAGGLSNVATVLSELVGLDGKNLAEIASFQPIPVAQRLGWLLQWADANVDLEPLESVVRARSRSTLLDPARPRRGPVDGKWGVRINAPVEADS